MAISLAEEREWRCSNCHAATVALTWLAIDIVERPDLRGFLAEHSWLRIDCPQCDAAIHRNDPLLVTRLSDAAPVIMAVADDVVDAADPPEVSRPVIERVRAALGDIVRDIPGPLLLVPFEVLALAAARDIDADVGIRQENAEAMGDRYSRLLEMINQTSSERRLALALNRLWAVESVEELKRLVSEFPELASPPAQELPARKAEQAGDEEERHVAESRLGLVQAIATGDLEGGWAAYEIAMQRLLDEYIGPSVTRLTQELQRCHDAGDHPGVVIVGTELRAMAIRGGISNMEADVSMMIAHALLDVPGEGRPQRIEEAIVLMRRVLEILDADPELNKPELRAETLANLGSAYGARLLHDPAANMEQAIACQRQALELISMDGHGRLWAMAHTNLGLSLLERLVLKPSQEPRSAEETIREAIEHFDTALRWRSFERDPLDWAFTQINLGLAFARREVGNRRANALKGIEHFESAAAGFAEADAHWLRAQALHNIAVSLLDLANLDDTDSQERAGLLASAKTAAQSSLQERSVADSPIEAGRTWEQLARVLEALGDRAGGIDAYRHALEGLTPLTSPRPCRDVARVLAAMAAEADDWPLAAMAWETAVEAAVAASEARATSEGRFEEARKNLNIFRWAAYALTRVGRLERAVEVLELGRARELGAWLHRDMVDLDRLGHLDPSLRDRFVQLRWRLEQFDRAYRGGIASPGDDAGETAESFRATIKEIQALPGFGMFLDRPTFNDISRAARPREPIVYVVTSPHGSVALIVWADQEPHSRATVQLVDVGALTSTELVQLLMKVDVDTDTVGGYVVAQSGENDDLDRLLTELGSLVGRLLRPLAAALSAGGASAVCLVPIMLMGLLPLHALQWQQLGESRCLIDDFDVVIAPSATVRSVCLERAAQRVDDVPRLLAVGNPLPHPLPLDGAESEVQMVALAFPSDRADVLVGSSATKEAVVAKLPGATHVHLACHGWADAREGPLTALLSFADDEVLSAREIVDLNGVVARLVVASACQTGVVQGYETADEALGLATALLGAGAAGVVASLWPVDDYATALLMVRFYEILAPGVAGRGDGAEPAAALRAAQLWLRRLTPEDEESYLDDHPVLRQHRNESAGRAASRAGPRHDSRPYFALEYWAPFVFVGA